MFWNALWLALREIQRNKLRSMLTMLGIVIGVAAVITMVTLGDGATVQVSRQIASLGSNLIMIQPSRHMGPARDGARAPAFRKADVEAIQREIPNVEAVAPVSTTSLTAVVGNRNWSSSVIGSDNGFFEVRDWPLTEGREFSASELSAGSGVCIVGATVASELYGNQNPIGARVRVGKMSCDIIGILTEKGQSAMGSDQDSVIIMPIRAFQRRISGSQDIGMIQVSATSEDAVDGVQADLTSLFRERRHIAPNEDDNFHMMSTQEISETLAGTMQVLTALLGAVAAVSLLVGGIGIMNIMLVSVTERTREIGIRLAIGALERDVLMQFLVEAMVLTSIGGLIGIALAILASILIGNAINVPFIFNPGVVVLGFVFSTGVGVVFGFFPARRAARMAPIEALRHE